MCIIVFFNGKEVLSGGYLRMDEIENHFNKEIAHLVPIVPEDSHFAGIYNIPSVGDDGTSL